MRRVLPLEPPDLVDLLLDLQALEVVELGLVGLEGAVDVVLAAARVRCFGLKKRGRGLVSDDYFSIKKLPQA